MSHYSMKPLLLILITVIVTSAIWSNVVKREPADDRGSEQEEMDGDKAMEYLSNFPNIPCTLTFWDERGVAIRALGVSDEMLPYQKMDDVSVEVCTTDNNVGNGVVLTAKHPNGWGQTTDWEVRQLVHGRAAAAVPFTMTIGYGSTDSTPQCTFNTQVNDASAATDANGMPEKVTVDCREADLRGQGTGESFVIDFVAKIATRVEPVPESAVSASGLVSISYRSPLYQPHAGTDGVLRLAETDLSLYTDAASYRAPNYSQEGTLVVSHDATWDEARCNLPPTMETGKLAFDRTATFGGATWNVMEFSDAGAGNRYDSVLYRAAYGGTCYEITTTLHSASDWTDVDLDAIEASQKAMEARLEEAVMSISIH